MASTISAADLKTATDTVNTDVLLASIMDVLDAASDAGFYNAILPYVVSSKQNSALVSLGYVVTIDETNTFTTVDWSGT